MKKTLIFLTLALINVLYCSSIDKNKIYFSIDTNNRQIIFPLQINDSINAHLLFDTGAGYLILDSTFCNTHPSLLMNFDSKETMRGLLTVKAREKALIYKGTPKVLLGTTKLLFDSFIVTNFKRLSRVNIPDGTFNIPTSDTTNIWELNFENNYLEIHDQNYKIPEGCILLPFKRMGFSKHILLKFPIQIKCSNGDSITIDQEYIVDTGSSNDITIMNPAKEMNFFDKRNDDAVWTKYDGWYYRYYNVHAAMFHNYTIDSLRIYTFDRRNDGKNLIGLNFLKRFNVFFDMKNNVIGLQPVANYQRLYNPVHRRFHYATDQNSDGKFFVTYIADYKKNYYKNSGLRVGDEIVSVNGIPYKDLTFLQKYNFCEQDTLIFEIIRNTQKLTITVPVDKNEIQGD